MRVLFFAFALIACRALALNVESLEPQRGRQLPNITWIDENDRAHRVAELAGYPVILLPVYTHCSATCPLNVTALKNALSRTNATPKEYRVLLFSFDETETTESLRAFRTDQQLPISWLLGRADVANIEKLTDSISFQFGRSGSEFVHPNQLIVLDAHLAIAKAIFGSAYRANEIDRALLVAAGKSDWLGRNAPVLYGLVLFAASAFAILLVHFVLVRRRMTIAVAAAV